MKKILLCILTLLLLFAGCADGGGEAEDAAAPPHPPAADNRITLTLSGDVTEEELLDRLRSLPRVQRVIWRDCPLSGAEQLALAGKLPALRFIWETDLPGTRAYTNVTELDLSRSRKKNVDALRAALPLFDRLETVDLSGWKLSAEEDAALRAEYPDTVFRHEVQLFDRTFYNTDTEIDLSGIPMEDTSELEAALPLFYDLQKVRMLDCGPDDKTMDALNQKYAPTRFIWITQVFCHGLETDSTYYTMYNARYARYPGTGVKNFRYCPDLVALDLGHSGVFTQDLDFLAYTPHLRWLILGECHVEDLTPLASLKELEYLELFLNPCSDLTPLLECPALTDLNLCYTSAVFYSDNMELFKQMTQLQRLWIYGARLTQEQLDDLQGALPGCEIGYGWGQESTGGGWRQHEHYYAMRDALHMHYMN